MNNSYTLTGYWIKVHPDQPKSYKFVCSNCGGMIHSTALDKTKKVSVCIYRYCPHCGRPMEVFI